MPSLFISGSVGLLWIVFGIFLGTTCSAEECMGMALIILGFPAAVATVFLIQMLITFLYKKFNYKKIFILTFCLVVTLCIVFGVVGKTIKTNYPYPRESHEQWAKVAVFSHDPNVCLEKVRPYDRIISCLDYASIMSGSEIFCENMDKVKMHIIPPIDRCLAQLKMMKDYLQTACHTNSYDLNCLKQVCKEVETGYCNMSYVYQAKAISEKDPSWCDRIEDPDFGEELKQDCYREAGSGVKFEF